MELQPDHIDDAAAWVIAIVDGDQDPPRWEEPPAAGGWTPRRTLDHLVDVMVLYGGYVARRAQGRIAPPRDGDPAADRCQLIDALVSTSAALQVVVADLGDGEQAFHPSGLADQTGWIGMAVTELLVHGHDIATGTGSAVPPLEELAGATVERVLPWAAGPGSGWDQLLWATGRIHLGGRPDQGPEWWWQSAPLADWDGTPRRRSAPPAW